MAAERKLVESHQRLSVGIQSASLASSTEEDKNFKEESFLSDATSSSYQLTNAASINSNFNKKPAAVSGHGGTNSEAYGNGSIHPRAERKISFNCMQANNDAPSCYLTGNNPYATRSMVGGECLGLNPASSVAGPTISLRSRDSNSIKTGGLVDTKVSLGSKSYLSAPSDLFKYSGQSQYCASSNKVPQLGYDYRSSVLYKGTYSAKEISLSNHVQKLFSDGSSRYMTNNQTGVGYDGYKLGDKSSNRNSNSESLRDSTRGPRSRRMYSLLSLTDENEHQLGSRIRRDRYNRSDFVIKYDNAKFFIIKSYSEYDIHKSIKYDVWSSTPHGNRKLDAAFRDAVATYSEKGTRCPIFLFFSVNGSGQFLGLAEMTGPVDYDKDMDFWQQSKWSGFFPVTWHIIKDIPNNRLKHIILQNNDNKPVTYTRDTQEVGLKQGLEMLSIFNSFGAVTSMLDDYKYYDEQERYRQFNKTTTESSQIHAITDFRESSPRKTAEQVSSESFTSLAALARNLSLSDNSMRRF